MPCLPVKTVIANRAGAEIKVVLSQTHWKEAESQEHSGACLRLGWQQIDTGDKDGHMLPFSFEHLKGLPWLFWRRIAICAKQNVLIYCCSAYMLEGCLPRCLAETQVQKLQCGREEHNLK